MTAARQVRLIGPTPSGESAPGKRATRVAVLADSSKFTEPLFAQIAGLDRADYLVTDAEPPAELAEALAQAGVEVLVADPASSPR